MRLSVAGRLAAAGAGAGAAVEEVSEQQQSPHWLQVCRLSARLRVGAVAELQSSDQ